MEKLFLALLLFIGLEIKAQDTLLESANNYYIDQNYL
jgi:hypothetical protein